jgi:hypothetical protein
MYLHRLNMYMVRLRLEASCNYLALADQVTGPRANIRAPIALQLTMHGQASCMSSGHGGRPSLCEQPTNERRHLLEQAPCMVNPLRLHPSLLPSPPHGVAPTLHVCLVVELYFG